MNGRVIIAPPAMVDQAQTLGDVLREWADEIYQNARQFCEFAATPPDWRFYLSDGELGLIETLVASQIWSPKE